LALDRHPLIKHIQNSIFMTNSSKLKYPINGLTIHGILSCRAKGTPVSSGGSAVYDAGSWYKSWQPVSTIPSIATTRHHAWTELLTVPASQERGRHSEDSITFSICVPSPEAFDGIDTSTIRLVRELAV
jgi:hypothetical protein